MTERIRNSGDAPANRHYHTLCDAIGPPPSGRCSRGENPVINVDAGIKLDIRTGRIVYHTDRLIPARAYER